MKANIEEMITLNYEIEGLLYLAMHRGNDTPREVWNMIASKIESLRESLPSEKMEEKKTDQPTDFATIVKDEEAEAAESEPMKEPSFVPEEIVEDASTKEFVEPEVITPDPEVEAMVENADVTTASTEINTVNDGEQVEPIRLDEKLARVNSRDLKKAFSLNDRFRFRRELFGNSDTEMADTLNLIEAMNSIDEARDYFYNDLHWDKTNQEVADFIEIISHHFSGK